MRWVEIDCVAASSRRAKTVRRRSSPSPALDRRLPALGAAAQQGDQIGRRHRLLAQVEDAVAVDQVLEQGGIGPGAEHEVDPRLRAGGRLGLLEQPQGPLAGDGAPQGQHGDRLRRQQAQGLRPGTGHQQMQLGSELAQTGLDRLAVETGQQRGGE